MGSPPSLLPTSWPPARGWVNRYFYSSCLLRTALNKNREILQFFVFSIRLAIENGRNRRESRFAISAVIENGKSVENSIVQAYCYASMRIGAYPPPPIVHPYWCSERPHSLAAKKSHTASVPLSPTVTCLQKDPCKKGVAFPDCMDERPPKKICGKNWYGVRWGWNTKAIPRMSHACHCQISGVDEWHV